MPAKRALIVDDSLSARVILSRMLQKHGLEVDTAESAEAAIAYLAGKRPDVIFMDHLMPGMDGFQAVQAIKNNPRTATIPIMMYTSQQGELYVGQARALGAVGVLPKLMKPVDVSKVLYQLHLLPERRDAEPSAFVPAQVPALRTPEVRAEQPDAASLQPADWRQQLEAALRNHDADLRRFVVANLDTFADRVTGDIRNYINETPALQVPPPPPAVRPPYLWVAAILLALVPGVLLAVLHLRTLDSNRVLAAQMLELQRANAGLDAELKRLREVETQRASMLPSAPSRVAGVEDASVGFAPIVAPVPYGEVPLALGRLDVLRQLLAGLEERSFRGIVEVRSYFGRYCMVGNASEGYALAPDDMPALRCDVRGNPFAESLSPAQRQSLAFANLAASVRRRSGGAISVAVVDSGEVVPVHFRAGELATAGEWNELAARNNRVEFVVLPGEPR